MTSQFWITSTPSRLAARAKPHATASCRTVPPRGCSRPPRIGKRALSKSAIGSSLRTSSTPRNSPSTPCRRIEFAAPHEGVTLRVAVEQVQHAALADHRVVIDVLLETLPELHRPFVERDVAGHQVVRADDRRVATDIAAAEPTFFDDGDVANAVDFRQVIGRREPVAATADDDDVVVSPAVRRRATPVPSRDGRVPPRGAS